ncbi:MAG: hypothetical protein BGO98_48295 [Myxococcales bacterium 68-20]|mgnify:CR=1 FL=1|nr:MAG: hypothetical protein BGO98_48295 [Myxococcales bacterium 68-20]
MSYRSWILSGVALSISACGGIVPSDSLTAGAQGASTASTPLDFSIEPASVDEARALCARPPTEWEVTPTPAPSDYAGSRWIMCNPSLVLDVNQNGSSTIEGRPYSTWGFALQEPQRETMVVVFPIDDTNGYGIGSGRPERARGGFSHWLRLPVDPNDSGLLAPKLNGMTEATFVRIKAPERAPEPEVQAPEEAVEQGPQPPEPYPWVASCPAPPDESWVPRALPTGSIDDFRAYFDAFRAQVVGHWRGQMTAFGTSRPVTFAFESNGHYSGMCLDALCGALVYYRTDAESDAKQYRLDNMNLDGVVSGTIDLAFPPQPIMGESPNDPPWVPEVGTTRLEKVELDASGNRLRFDFVSHLQSPPTIAHYDLWRCP